MISPTMLPPCLIILTGLLCSCSPSGLSDEPIGEAWSQGNSLSFDGLERSYSVYVPSSGAPQGLILLLHGSGQSTNQMISETDVEGTAEQDGLLVVAPAGLDGGWNDEDPPGNRLADDVGFIDALVTELKASYPSLLSQHVFAHGFSNGGGLATRLACESTQIRGVGVLGNYYTPTLDSCPRPVGHPVPGWFGAGTEDELVPVESVQAAMPSYVADLTDCSDAGSLQAVEDAELDDGVLCKEFPACNGARLCEYTGRGHEVLPGSLGAAWRFLSARVASDMEEPS